MSDQHIDNASGSAAGTPAWREPMVWLVWGGPAAVVVAGVITVVIAVQGADPEVSKIESSQASTMPAIQARNHVATPKAQP